MCYVVLNPAVTLYDENLKFSQTDTTSFPTYWLGYDLYSVLYRFIIIHIISESAVLTVMFWLAAEQMDDFSPVWIFANNRKGVKLIL